MKIGILTYHRAYNFGAFLQAFALKSFLEQQGHEVSFVDYWPEEHALLNKPFRKESVSGLKSFVHECLLYRNRHKRYSRFSKIQVQYLGIERAIQYTNPEQLASLNYDCIIYGSDQIWWKNRLAGRTSFDGVYWGDFVPAEIRKVAYAASMGVINVADEDKTYIREHLRNFQSLSVRETVLADTIRDLADSDVSVVLDPTLLVDASFWDRYVHDVPEKDYILYYKVMGNEACDRAVESFGHEQGLKVITVSGSLNTWRRLDSYSRNADAFGFISLIKHARYVVSTSFHGVAFSIVFKKPFVAMGMGDNSHRVQSLLQSLGLCEQMNDSPQDGISIPIPDYSQVAKRLSAIRACSADYLKSALQ